MASGPATGTAKQVSKNQSHLWNFFSFFILLQFALSYLCFLLSLAIFLLLTFSDWNFGCQLFTTNMNFRMLFFRILRRIWNWMLWSSSAIFMCAISLCPQVNILFKLFPIMVVRSLTGQCSFDYKACRWYCSWGGNGEVSSPVYLSWRCTAHDFFMLLVGYRCEGSPRSVLRSWWRDSRRCCQGKGV